MRKFWLWLGIILIGIIMLGLLGIVIVQLMHANFNDHFWVGLIGILAFGYVGRWLLKSTKN